MKAASYIEALLPDSVSVLGIKLRPFSVGHLLLLSRYVKMDCSESSLALCLLICSRSYQDALDLLTGSGLDRALSKLHRKTSRRFWVFPVRVDWISAWETFFAYHEKATIPPKLLRPSDTEPRKTGLPEILLFWTRLSGRYRWSEFLDLPVASVVWECVALTEQETDGKIRVLGEDEGSNAMTPEQADEILAAFRAQQKPEEVDRGQ